MMGGFCSCRRQVRPGQSRVHDKTHRELQQRVLALLCHRQISRFENLVARGPACHIPLRALSLALHLFAQAFKADLFAALKGDARPVPRPLLRLGERDGIVGHLNSRGRERVDNVEDIDRLPDLLLYLARARVDVVE